jgi:hypothetical protein
VEAVRDNASLLAFESGSRPSRNAAGVLAVHVPPTGMETLNGGPEYELSYSNTIRPRLSAANVPTWR